MDRTLVGRADPSRLAANTATGDSLGQTTRVAGDGPIVDDHDSCFFGYMQGGPGPLRRAPPLGSFFWLAPSWRKGTVGPSLVWGWKMLACIITFLQVVKRCRVPTGENAGYRQWPNEKHQAIELGRVRGAPREFRVARVMSVELSSPPVPI